MHKRCADVKCAGADAAAGFVSLVSNTANDWTNADDEADAKFTLFLVMKTYQQSGDVNPMGVIQVATGGAAIGLGLYKLPSKCKSVLASTIAAVGTSGTILGTAERNHLHLTADTWGLRSQHPGAYNGMFVHIQDPALDATTLQRFTHLVCKIDQYIISGIVKISLTANAQTKVTLQGGAGTVAGWTPSDQGGAGQWPTLRFGKISTAGAGVLADIIITAVTAN